MTANGRHNRKGDSRLLAALAAGRTVRDAAQQAGIGERTAYRRLKDREFQREIRKLRSGMIDTALGRLSDAATAAVGTLLALLNAESENVRLAASRSILELGCKLRESTELEQRLSDLENLVDQQ